MIIAIDFDGVCVSNEFPKVGQEIGAVPVLLQLTGNGHKLILLTNRDGDTLKDALSWFKAYGIELYDINKNPQQWHFSNSPKIYADLYIDDRGLGSPLKKDNTISKKPFLDWEIALKLLKKYKYL